MSKNPLYESFSWFPKEYQIQKATEKSVIIKVKAGRGGAISKNNRKYIDEELIRAARTATGRLVDVNHNCKGVGKIHLADYEEGDLEFVTEVWKEPYVTLLRTRSPEIKGFSIGANYLTNECSKCHKRFPTEDEYVEHMTKEEFIRDPVTIPRGVIFGEYALSIVTASETPGLDTSYEILETVQDGYSKLLETVIKRKIKEEEYDMSKINAGVTPRKEIAVGSVAEIKQPTEAPVKVEPVTPTLIAPETPIVETPITPIPKIDEAPIFTPKLAEVTLTESTITETVTIKPEGKITKLAEAITLKLKLGEPFAGYTNFEDCVSQNSDKENPEAYCGSIKHQTEEVSTIKKQLNEVTAKLNEVVNVLNAPLTGPKVNESWREQNKLLAEAITNLNQAVNSLPKPDLSWKEIKPYDDKLIKEAIAAIPKYDDTPIKAEITEVKTENKTLKETVSVLSAKITQLEQNLNAWTVTADKRAVELYTQVKTEQATKDTEKDKIIAELQSELEKTKTIAETVRENAMDNVKAKFKGVSKGVGTTDNKPVLEDPMKPKEKS